MEIKKMIVFRGVTPHNSYWISSADTRWSVGGHLVTDVSGRDSYVHLYGSPTWTFFQWHLDL